MSNENTVRVSVGDVFRLKEDTWFFRGTKLPTPHVECLKDDIIICVAVTSKHKLRCTGRVYLTFLHPTIGIISRYALSYNDPFVLSNLFGSPLSDNALSDRPDRPAVVTVPG